MPGMTDIYVLARRALLDVLGPQRHAVTLVGAQAVYLRVGDADLAVAPTTTDADIALDPSLLSEQPPIDDLMRRAGFQRRSDTGGKPMVGIWEKQVDQLLVSVDLLTPKGIAPPAGRRAARLPGHEKGTVLKVPGIEASLVDADLIQVGALERDDERAYDIKVAGQGALLIAKVHKILDREGHGNRLRDKDALDVFRILRGTSTEELAGRLTESGDDERCSAVFNEAMDALPELFGDSSGEGVLMAVRATEGLMMEAEVVEAVTALTNELISAVRGS